MCPEVFVLKEGNELVEMEETGFASEAEFQELLEKFPALLSGDLIDPSHPRKWVFVSREQGIPSEEGAGERWAVDHLFLDQDGVPTLVEVKRSTDTRIRREVVGQMLDYAANAVVYWPAEMIRLRFEAECEKRDEEPSVTLVDQLGLEGDVDEFWQKVELNLRAGRIRMLFVADKIPLELQRIVEFLNEQMKPAEVLAVEIRHYVGEGMKTLVPRVIGLTMKAQREKKSVRPSRQWDENSFFAELKEQHGADNEGIARKIYDWMNSKSLEGKFGQGATIGSYSIRLDIGGKKVRVFSLWTTTEVEIAMGNFREYPPFDQIEKREQLLSMLRDFGGLDLKSARPNSSPYFLCENLIGGNRLTAFLSIADGVLDELSEGEKVGSAANC